MAHTVYRYSYYAALPVLAVCVFVMLLLLIKLSYKLYVDKQSIHLMKFIHGTTTLCMCCCLICGTLDLVDVIMCSDRRADDNVTFIVVDTVNNCVYSVVVLSLFALFIGRLYYTFSGTVLALSNLFMYFVYLLLATSVVCFIPAEIGYASGNHLATNAPIKRVSIAIIICNDTILNVMCVALFLYKLAAISSKSAVLLHQHDYIEMLEPSAPHSDSKGYGEHHDSAHLDTVNIMIRHTILSVISIVFNQLWYMVLFYYTFFSGTHQITCNKARFIELVVRTLYLLVNCLVLYLNLNINHYLYSALCKVCHSSCYKCCRFNSTA